MSTLFKTFSKGSKESDILVFSSTKYLHTLHHHVEYEIFYLKEGFGTFYIENEKYQIKAGSILFIEPNTNHCFTDTSENFLYYSIVFKPAAFGPENDSCRSTLDQIKISTFINLPDYLIEKIEYITEKNKQKSVGLELQTRTVLYLIFYHIIESKQYMQFKKMVTNMDSHSMAVQSVCKYIQAHYSEKIDYDEILEQTNYSKSQFIKIFKKETGMNVTDYINNFRIERACLEILNSDKNITEIAIACGFNNIQYFSKRFKETMNCTPKEYKTNASTVMGDSI